MLVHYVDNPVQDYLQTAVSTTLSIHKNEGPGDVLVFLTGQDDVNAAVQLISEEAENKPGALLVLPLYAGLPPSDQVTSRASQSLSIVLSRALQMAFLGTPFQLSI